MALFTCRTGIKLISNCLYHIFFHLDSFSAAPVDTEAISKCETSTERVKNSLDSCNFNNQLADTFSIEHLLEKLNHDKVPTFSCLSPIDSIGLPYFKKYLKSTSIKQKDILCLPLPDGVHFQGYLVNRKERTIIHADSPRWGTLNNPTSKCITQVVFP